MSASPAAGRALLALIVGAVLIGFAPIFVRLSETGPTATAFWRGMLALPLLAIVWLPNRAAEPGGRPLLWLLLAGVFIAADLVVWHQSIRMTSVANATLMANLAPVFVTLASFLFLGERFRLTYLAGLALALAGAAVLVSHSLDIGRRSVLGDLLGVLAAVFYAGYLMGVSRARQQYSAAAVMGWTTLVMTPLLLIVAWLAGDTLLPMDARGWWLLLGLAWLSHAGGQGLIAWSLAHLPASFSAVGLLLQPVAAALFAWALLAEPFGTYQAIGGAIVLSGILICRMAMNPNQS